jgi:hypothetical protein
MGKLDGIKDVESGGKFFYKNRIFRNLKYRIFNDLQEKYFLKKGF